MVNDATGVINISNYHAAGKEFIKSIREAMFEKNKQEIHEYISKIYDENCKILSAGDDSTRISVLLKFIALVNSEIDTVYHEDSLLKMIEAVKKLRGDDISGLKAKLFASLAKFISSSSEYVENEILQSIEVMKKAKSSDAYYSVILSHEICVTVPTVFLQHANQYSNAIMNSLDHPETKIRVSSSWFLRSFFNLCLVKNEKRSQMVTIFKNFYKKSMSSLKALQSIPEQSLTQNDQNNMHGALLIINELLIVKDHRCNTIPREMEKKFVLVIGYDVTDYDEDRFLIDDRNDDFYFISNSQSPSSYEHLVNIMQPPLLRDLKSYSTDGEFSHFEVDSFLSEKFDEIYQVCSAIMSSKNLQSKNTQIVEVLLNIVSNLSFLNPKAFVSTCLKDVVHFIMECIVSNKSSSAAFQSFALLSQTMTLEMLPFGKLAIELIRNKLMTSECNASKTQFSFDPLGLACLCVISSNNVEIISTSQFQDILNILLTKMTFSPSVSVCLVTLSSLTKTRNKFIYDCLSVAITKIITVNVENREDVDKLILAFKTLCSFDCDSSLLIKLISVISEKHLFSKYTQIRMEAVKTSCGLMHPLITYSATSRENLSSAPSSNIHLTISLVIKRLIICGVSDPEPHIRAFTWQCLSHKYNSYLMQPENLMILSPTLYDESICVKRQAVALVASLCENNPICALPLLTNYSFELLSKMGWVGQDMELQNIVYLLKSLLSECERVAQMCCSYIMKSIIERFFSEIREESTVYYLEIFGILAMKCGQDFQQHHENVLKCCLMVMNDRASIQVKESLLVTITRLFRYSGYSQNLVSIYPSIRRYLFSIIRKETKPSLRVKIVRVLGLFGNLKVDHPQLNVESEIESIIPRSSYGFSQHKKESNDEVKMDMPVFDLLYNNSRGNDDVTLNTIIYPSVVIMNLLNLLKETRLVLQHRVIFQTLDDIFKSLGADFLNFLPQIMPEYLHHLKIGDEHHKEMVLKSLRRAILFSSDHLKPYLQELFQTINDIWLPDLNRSLLFEIISIMENMLTTMKGETRCVLPKLVIKMSKCMQNEHSLANAKDSVYLMARILAVIQNTCIYLTEYYYFLIPAIVQNFASSSVPTPVRISSIETLELICIKTDIRNYISLIILPLLLVFEEYPALRDSSMSLICAMMIRVGKHFEVFVPRIQSILFSTSCRYPKFEAVLDRLRNSSLYELELEIMLVDAQHRKDKKNMGKVKTQLSTSKKAKSSNDLAKFNEDSDTPANLSTETVNLWLEKSTNNSLCTSKEDWVQWFRRLSMDLIKESPSVIIRNCYNCCLSTPELTKNIFNVSFFSSWNSLSESSKKIVIQNLENSLIQQDNPEILNSILNLAEFMNRTEIATLPIAYSLLASSASKCHSYSTALYYKELVFLQNAKADVLEDLISINTRLNNLDSAQGALKYAVDNSLADLKTQQRWYERLHDWKNALSAYQKKIEQDPDDIKLLLGKMRCLEALGEWDELKLILSKSVDEKLREYRQQLAVTGAAMSLGLGDWDKLDNYSKEIPSGNIDRSFYQAVVCIKHDQHEEAQRHINIARDTLETELIGFVTGTADRVYGSIVNAQLFSESEEIMTFKTNPKYRQIIKSNWRMRLMKSSTHPDDWQKIFSIRSIVLPPKEDIYVQLKFASLCRKFKRYNLCHQIFKRLIDDPRYYQDDGVSLIMAPEHIESVSPMVLFHHCKLQWASTDDKLKAYSSLESLALHCSSKFSNSKSDPSLMVDGRLFKEYDEDPNSLLYKLYFNLGRWSQHLLHLGMINAEKTFSNYFLATKYNQQSRKIWHEFGMLNYEILCRNKQKKLNSQNEQDSSHLDPILSSDDEIRLTKWAFDAFFRSVSLADGSGENCLQDTLRILTLWFEHSSHVEVLETLWDQIKSVRIDNWLQVVPQLIARLNSTDYSVSILIQRLLTDIGISHPQALIYPLVVGSNNFLPRYHGELQSPVSQILQKMFDNQPILMEQVQMVSRELIRISILWHELWYQGIEEASRLYFNEANISEMLKVIDDLYKTMAYGPETLREISFLQSYGRDLTEARQQIEKYRETQNDFYLNQAWEYFYMVYFKLNGQLKKFQYLDLQYISPKLLACCNFRIAVPGTYLPSAPTICIQSFGQRLKVMSSKQRPRKLQILGDDGKTYSFLLKGHEDLRQDERVMQLFGLVNTLLANDQETSKRNLSICRYSVTPLSTNSGLIGWVSDCDTIINLVKNYREKKKINIDIENELTNKLCPNHQSLTIQQKVEIFHAVNEQISGDELRYTFWHNSPDSEEWFQRRVCYSRSLAVMSMVGYILGLGDRHPSNVLIEKLSGKILHIDFGDCFEVASLRSKFPEKVPFRLTRMLVQALEVTGVGGTFEITCNLTMNVLRAHKESIIAVLETFIYDPLLDWKLLNEDEANRQVTQPEDTMQLVEKIMDKNGNIKDAILTIENTPNLSSDTLIKPVPPSRFIPHPIVEFNYQEKRVELNKKALTVVNRIVQKLTGRDFMTESVLEVNHQVSLLIKQATKPDNLAQSFSGWCPFW